MGLAKALTHSTKNRGIAKFFVAMFAAGAIGFVAFAVFALVGDSTQAVTVFGETGELGARRVEIFLINIIGALYSGGIAYGLYKRSDYARHALFAPYGIMVPGTVIFQGFVPMIIPALVLSVGAWLFLYRNRRINEYFSVTEVASNDADR
ncbi:MAG: hypothetical protein ACR2QL_07015 [Woeseiaceae bacterium]